jgi:DNA replication protein DnaC
MTAIENGADNLEELLGSLGLRVMLRECAAAIAKAEEENWGYRRLVRRLAEMEANERLTRKVQRLLDDAELPEEFTLATLNQREICEKPRRQLPTLLTGEFVRRGDNLLCFGMPGRGKSHYCAAIARHLLQQHQMKVWFVEGYKLVSTLLAAKADNDLPRFLEKLGKVDIICVDDVGYVQHDAHEIEVLFTFIAERYKQQRTLMLTSNLVFSEWEAIFKNPLTAMAAIDRLIHRAIVLEFTRERSLRDEQFEQRQQS